MAEKFNEVIAQIRKNVQETKSTRYSKGDHTAVVQGLLNAKDHTVTYYSADSEGKAVATSSNPSQKLRESLKPLLKEVGISGEDLKRMDDYEFTKKQAEAIQEVAMVSTAAYLDTGRKLTLPVTKATENKMSIQKVEVAASEEETFKNEAQADGSYKRVSTGKKVKKDKRDALKVKNTTPPWLRHESSL